MSTDKLLDWDDEIVPALNEKFGNVNDCAVFLKNLPDHSFTLGYWHSVEWVRRNYPHTIEWEAEEPTENTFRFREEKYRWIMATEEGQKFWGGVWEHYDRDPEGLAKEMELYPWWDVDSLINKCYIHELLAHSQNTEGELGRVPLVIDCERLEETIRQFPNDLGWATPVVEELRRLYGNQFRVRYGYWSCAHDLYPAVGVAVAEMERGTEPPRIV